MDDFRKYATKHLGMNGMVLDDVIKSQAGYLNPYILEERQLNVTQLAVFLPLYALRNSPSVALCKMLNAMPKLLANFI